MIKTLHLQNLIRSGRWERTDSKIHFFIFCFIS